MWLYKTSSYLIFFSLLLFISTHISRLNLLSIIRDFVEIDCQRDSIFYNFYGVCNNLNFTVPKSHLQIPYWHLWLYVQCTAIHCTPISSIGDLPLRINENRERCIWTSCSDDDNDVLLLLFFFLRKSRFIEIFFDQHVWLGDRKRWV